MERDGTGHLSTIYTYGNQRINSESYNNLSGIYAYDGRGSVSAVIGSYGDFRASYWYDCLGNVKSQIHGYGAFGSGKKYYGYNAEQYNPVTGNQNLRARQVNIRRQRFLTEDTYIGTKTNILSINRYTYAENNPLKFKDPSGKSIIGPLEDLSNLAIGLLDKSIFKGGGNVAGYAQNKSGRINSIINKASALRDYIQCISDNYGEATLNVLDAATFIAGGFAGFKTITDANKNKIVTTNYWTWQGGGGFADVYDDIFHAFAKTDHDKIYIGNEYTIWLWKGDYWNLGAGGEIGIYNGVGNSVSTTMSDRLGINISMEIIDDNDISIVNIQNGNEYISSRDWGNITNPSEITKKVDSWWLTGWNPKVQGLANNNLTLTGVLDFSDNAKSREIYKKLIDSKDNPNNNYKSNIDDLGDFKIKITW